MVVLVTGLLSRRPAVGRGSKTSSTGAAPLEPAPPADELEAALICRMEGDDRPRDDDEDVRARLIPEADRRSCAGIAEGAKDCPLLSVGDNGRTAADTPGPPAILEDKPVTPGAIVFALRLF